MTDICEKLIESVKNFPVLYDTTDENYKNMKVKEEIWQDISDDLNINAKEVWRKLRDCHRDALKKYTRPVQEGKTLKKWKYEDLMEFLLPWMKNRKTISYYENGLNDIESAEDGEASTSYQAQKRMKKNQSDPDLEFLIKSTKEKEDRHQQRFALQNTKKEDPLDMFFKAMCEMTKRLPKHHQAKIKRTLFSAVQEAEDTVLDEESKEPHQ